MICIQTRCHVPTSNPPLIIPIKMKGLALTEHRFEVPIAVAMKNYFFWNILLCSPVNVNRSLEDHVM
jgi:hypothetical protein